MRVNVNANNHVQVSTGGRALCVMNTDTLTVIEEPGVLRVIVSPHWRGIVETVTPSGAPLATYHGPRWIRALRAWYWWWRGPAYRVVWGT